MRNMQSSRNEEMGWAEKLSVEFDMLGFKMFKLVHSLNFSRLLE